LLQTVLGLAIGPNNPKPTFHIIRPYLVAFDTDFLKNATKQLPVVGFYLVFVYLNFCAAPLIISQNSEILNSLKPTRLCMGPWI
jgi:hypothetical protein